MSEKDKMITAQAEVIGILFEIVKRLQANSDLDREYLRIAVESPENRTRLEEIAAERDANADVVARLLESLKVE